MAEATDVDLILVKKAQAGDKRAFDLLVLKYQHKLATVVIQLVSERDIVEDIVQESFVKAYRALSGFRGDSAFFTWLHRIATNTAKNHLESAARKPSYRAQDLDAMMVIETPEPLKSEESPDNLLARGQLESELNQLLNTLPEELRVAITLREFEGKSYEDISHIMGTPIGTVRSRIFRAREFIETNMQSVMAGRNRLHARI